jgi:hypothetical protein
MRYILTLSVLLLLLSGCAVATNSSITGIWQATHALGMPVSNGIYYEFGSGNTVSRATVKSNLFTSNADNTGTYTLDASGNLVMSFISSYTYTVYINGQYMYWYISGIEGIRFLKQ